MNEHVPGSQKDQRHGRGVNPVLILGIGHAIDFRAANVFSAAPIDHVAEVGEIAANVVIAGEARRAFAAGYPGSQNYFLADVDGADFGPNFVDYASDVTPRNVRERDGNPRQPTPHPEVEMVEGARMHAD
jgi:hypothetical protein